MRKLNKLLTVLVIFFILIASLIYIKYFNNTEQITDTDNITDFTKTTKNDTQPKNNTVNDNADKRISLTPENISQYNPPLKPNCSEKFNKDTPDVTVKYENKSRGIILELPYNKNWGNETYKINPYDKWNDENGKEYILFGPLTNFEGCSWVRNYALYFYPANSADIRIEEMKKTPNYLEIFILKPIKKSINGLDVIEFQRHGLCDNSELEIVGKKYNYVLRPLCGADFEFLENISKSIKLID